MRNPFNLEALLIASILLAAGCIITGTPNVVVSSALQRRQLPWLSTALSIYCLNAVVPPLETQTCVDACEAHYRFCSVSSFKHFC